MHIYVYIDAKSFPFIQVDIRLDDPTICMQGVCARGWQLANLTAETVQLHIYLVDLWIYI